MALALGGLLLLCGCAGQRLITGEPMLYGINHATGQVVDRDLATAGTYIHKGEILTVMVNTVFVKLLKDRGNPHVLVYAEVHDDGTDNPETAYRRVLYNEENTPPGVNLGVADRVLYGPAPYKGFPLRIKFYIVELDKEDKKLASRLINAVGTTASMAQPQYATGINMAVQLAQALNELNEDDFELRMDLSLHPLTSTITYDVADRTLARTAPEEPVQRQGKEVHLATPLRTGSFVILKRELAERLPQVRGQPSGRQHEEASIISDFAQEAFFREYPRADAPSRRVRVVESLRFQGGYLYRIIGDIPEAEGMSAEEKSVGVLDPENPGVATVLAPGIRLPSKDRTYAAFTVVGGLPEAALDAQAMRQSSDRDLADIRELLDNPDRVPLSERLGPQLESLTGAVAAKIEYRRLANQAARRAGVDPAFRSGGDYPVFWIQHLESLSQPTESANERRNRAARNAEILATLAEIVINLPPVNPADDRAIGCLKKSEASHFEPLSQRPGLFSLKTEAVAAFRNCQGN